ncbi:MAG: entericidin [Prevotella sp.]|jgi:hypothetical protein|nr:entericidin [uncultured Prevotella sp.]MBF1646036.1 entericidin [Prevotella sp.]
MKKLVLMFVAIAAISFASCNGNSKPAANVDTTSQDSAVDSMQQDSAHSDSAKADSAKADSTVKK